VSVTRDRLDALKKHWALTAIGDMQQEQAKVVVDQLTVSHSLGNQLRSAVEPAATNLELLRRLLASFEIAALEGLKASLNRGADEHALLLRQQTEAAAHQAYGIMQVLDVPSSPEDRILHILKLGAFAYCGDRWSDMRRWLQENEDSLATGLTPDSWDMRMLHGVYHAWIGLLRKRDWDDLSNVAMAVASLRHEQGRYEEILFSRTQPGESQPVAMRLIALYHWAKATELIGQYMLQGQPLAIEQELDKHYEAAVEAAMSSFDFALEMLLRWLHYASRTMATGSTWSVAHAINSRVSSYVKHMTETQALFELLPPQKAAIREQGLLDPAAHAVVVDLPTSGGKTILAEFRILQALNQFSADGGWVAYVAPTKALVGQLTRRIRKHFDPMGIRVEQLTGAIEVDSYEEELLGADRVASPFDVLVSTPEKLQLVIRNQKIQRPLALLVIDEAQNLEDEERGLRIELLIATVKRDHPKAAFLLLMPKVPNPTDLTAWLDPESGKTVSLSTSAWRPNDRIVGIYRSRREVQGDGDWSLEFRTLLTDPNTIHLQGDFKVGATRPLEISFTKAKSLSAQTAAMARVFSDRGTSVAVARTIPDAWSMADKIARSVGQLPKIPEDIQLVKKYLETEIGPGYELIRLLECGIAVHHAELSDETRTLIEWLAENNSLRALCATTTIAQGINFPIGSVFLASIKYPYGKEMPHRAFWNLAGRAGRINHDSVGVVGIAEGVDHCAVERFVCGAADHLVSRLVSLLDGVEKAGKLNNLELVLLEDEWADFRCYIAHLWKQKQNLEAVLAETEQLLRSTYGYGYLRSRTEADQQKAKALLDATKAYAKRLSSHPQQASLADATGFSPEAVLKALGGLASLERRLDKTDWEPSSLFGSGAASILPDLIGVMLRLPQIGKSLEEIGSHGSAKTRIADIARAWINGESIDDIAESFFPDTSSTKRIGAACKAIYKVLANCGTWGLAALSKLPTSGIDIDSMTATELRRVNLLGAMLYHGVHSEAAVLMRMNSVPRTVAEELGARFASTGCDPKPSSARIFLRELKVTDWDRARPKNAPLSGIEYQQVWKVMAGLESVESRSAFTFNSTNS
jgi:hypothetical protein